MKVLLDENLPHKLRLAIIGHDVVTVGYMGWNGLTNGNLLRAAEDANIDVMLTGDRTMRYEQNLNDRRIAVVSLSAQKWQIIRDYIPEIQVAVDTSAPGSFKAVFCGVFRRPGGREPGPSL